MTVPKETLKLLITGSPQSKANSRRLVLNRKTNKLMSIKSKAALAYEESALWQLKSQLRGRAPLIGDLSIDVTIYYKTKHNDLDPSLIFDVMQKAQAFENDRQLYIMTLRKRHDKLHPRAEIMLQQL